MDNGRGMGSAPTAKALQDTTEINRDTSHDNFAFLVHSQETLNRKMPPEADNQLLARQKRRRTSPEDHAILEGEYQRNPKPEKAARMEIVRRVALGEKEVQIWFQNRRQMTRRKSRPLLSREALFDLHSSQEGQEYEHAFSSSQSSSANSQDVDSLHTKPLSTSTVLAIDAEGSLANPWDERVRPLKSLAQPKENTLHSEILEHSRTTATANLFQPPPQTAFIKSRSVYFANRRSASFVIHNEGSHAFPLTMPLGASSPGMVHMKEVERPTQPLKRASSIVKLSMSLDGKAEVTTRTGETPSPPRSQPTPPIRTASLSSMGLQRSFSAVEPSNKSLSDSIPVPTVRRSMAGRSRDARTWEFYCDSDARNALTEQAEREEKGSATAAIGLIRSRSYNSKTMTSVPNKRNAQTQKNEAMKCHKSDGQKQKKQKLESATSSVARFQTTNSNVPKQKLLESGKKHEKSFSQSGPFEIYNEDSDKENWEPGTQTRIPRERRPVTTQLSARILLESVRVSSESSSLDTLMNRESNTSRRSVSKSSSTEGKENAGPVVDDEVADFMGKSVPREEEDLDCVQNLLSLSQAAWQ